MKPDRKSPLFVSRKALRWTASRSIAITDDLAAEEPLEIRIKGRAIAVTMRTPGHDPELVAGFLLSEGVIRRAADVVDIQACSQGEAALHGNIINVFLTRSAKFSVKHLTRHVFASSSCGLCGKASIEAISSQFEPLRDRFRVGGKWLAELPNCMRKLQLGFDRTGGLHAAALFDVDNGLMVLREDVGRHNAVDKVLGWAFLERLIPLSRAVLVVSGRASFELTQKAWAAGVPLLCAVSAPSSLAVELAERSGICLAGFVREGRMNLYANAWRVTR